MNAGRFLHIFDCLRSNGSESFSGKVTVNNAKDYQSFIHTGPFTVKRMFLRQAYHGGDCLSMYYKLS